MGDLRDQLRKANLLSKKDQKRLAHEERMRRKELGREGLEAEHKARAKELEQLEQGEREQRKREQQALDEARAQREELAQCEQILEQEARAPMRGGNQRWFFELPDGRLPSMVLNRTDAHALTNGQLCIVRKGPPESHVYGLLPIAHRERVAAALPDRVVWPRS